MTQDEKIKKLAKKLFAESERSQPHQAWRMEWKDLPVQVRVAFRNMAKMAMEHRDD